MKGLFRGKGLPVFDTKETVIELNNIKIEAFPSHHLDAIRGLPNISFILLDEAERKIDAICSQRSRYDRHSDLKNRYPMLLKSCISFLHHEIFHQMSRYTKDHLAQS
jgi:hypothetical protein